MKKLPTKWCIKVTSENKDVLSSWRTAGGKVENGWLDNSHTLLGLWSSTKPPGHKEITFEEFNMFVLNKSSAKIVEDYSYLVKLLKKLNIV